VNRLDKGFKLYSYTLSENHKDAQPSHIDSIFTKAWLSAKNAVWSTMLGLVFLSTCHVSFTK